MADILMGILFIAYIVASWWAINKIWYSKRVYLVHDSMQFYVMKFIYALILGWIAIPIALIMRLINK